MVTREENGSELTGATRVGRPRKTWVDISRKFRDTGV